MGWTMRATRYYQLGLVLPVAVPAAVVGPLILYEKIFDVTVGRTLPGILNAVVLILMGSLVLAGLPYTLFAIVSLVALRGRDALAYRRFTVAAPPLFVPVFWLWNAVGAVREGTLHVFKPVETFAGAAALVLPLGYLYVALCYLGYRLLAKRGLLQE